MPAPTYREALKAILLDVITNDKDLFKEVMIEIARANPHLLEEYFIRQPKGKPKELSEEEEGIRKEQIIKMINEDFERYDEVFKALAKL
jgi:hypothetical protein